MWMWMRRPLKVGLCVDEKKINQLCTNNSSMQCSSCLVQMHCI